MRPRWVEMTAAQVDELREKAATAGVEGVTALKLALEQETLPPPMIGYAMWRHVAEYGHPQDWLAQRLDIDIDTLQTYQRAFNLNRPLDGHWWDALRRREVSYHAAQEARRLPFERQVELLGVIRELRVPDADLPWLVTEAGRREGVPMRQIIESEAARSDYPHLYRTPDEPQSQPQVEARGTTLTVQIPHGMRVERIEIGFAP